MLLANSSRSRISPIKILECPYFVNPHVETLQFIEAINLKDSVEKDAFLK